MLTDAVSLQNDEMLRLLRHKSFSNNRSGDPLKTCQSFSGFVTKKTVVPILLPYKIKLLESHAIPKNCPIYFSMIKKMPLNILQQKTTDIHTDWFQQRSVKSLVCFVFFLSISLVQKLHPDYRFKNKIVPLSWLFFTILI